MLTALDIEYTRFNARRTLAALTESEFRVERFGSVVALLDPARPKPGYPNRVLGLTPETLPVLDEVLARYADAGLVPEIQVLREDSSKLEQGLRERGFALVHHLGYFARKPGVIEAPDIVVERWGPDRADELIDLFRHAGVECSSEIRERRRKYYCTDELRAFVALIDGRNAAWATLFVSGKQGFFANAWTLTELRGRGCQTALLAARLRDAVELGLERVVTDLVEESQSQRNAERAGFKVETIETVWQREL